MVKEVVDVVNSYIDQRKELQFHIRMLLNTPVVGISIMWSIIKSMTVG